MLTVGKEIEQEWTRGNADSTNSELSELPIKPSPDELYQFQIVDFDPHFTQEKNSRGLTKTYQDGHLCTLINGGQWLLKPPQIKDQLNELMSIPTMNGSKDELLFRRKYGISPVSKMHEEAQLFVLQNWELLVALALYKPDLGNNLIYRGNPFVTAEVDFNDYSITDVSNTRLYGCGRADIIGLAPDNGIIVLEIGSSKIKGKSAQLARNTRALQQILSLHGDERPVNAFIAKYTVNTAYTTLQINKPDFQALQHYADSKLIRSSPIEIFNANKHSV